MVPKQELYKFFGYRKNKLLLFLSRKIWIFSICILIKFLVVWAFLACFKEVGCQNKVNKSILEFVYFKAVLDLYMRCEKQLCLKQIT